MVVGPERFTPTFRKVSAMCLVIIRWQENGPLKDALSLEGDFFSLGTGINPRGIDWSMKSVIIR